MPEIFNMHEAKTQLSRLVARALAGEEIIIGRAGEPIVKLIPFTSCLKNKRTPGLLRGQLSVSEDFDAEDSEILKMFGIEE